MKKIILFALTLILAGIIVSFNSTNIPLKSQTEYLYINGMKYVVIHSEGGIQVVNVTKDLLEIEYYKKR